MCGYGSVRLGVRVPPSAPRSRGRACVCFVRCQRLPAGFAEFGANRRGAQRDRIQPDLHAAALGMDHRPVVRQDLETVDEAGGAKVIEPEPHPTVPIRAIGW